VTPPHLSKRLAELILRWAHGRFIDFDDEYDAETVKFSQ